MNFKVDKKMDASSYDELMTIVRKTASKEEFEQMRKDMAAMKEWQDNLVTQE